MSNHKNFYLAILLFQTLFFGVFSIIFSFFQWLNFLSLDVVLISLAWQEVFARTAGISLKWEERAALALSIWMVYIIDHLADSMLPVSQTITSTYNLNCREATYAPRHQFVRSHGILLGGLLFLAVVASIWLLGHLSRELLIAGRMIACGTAVYLALNHWFLRHGRWFKGREVLISLIFSIGCALAPMIQSNRPWLFLPWIAAFAAVAFINCTLIARMERKVNVLALAPRWTFSPQWVLCFCLVMVFLSAPFSVIVRALCWSLGGLVTIPSLAQRFGRSSLLLLPIRFYFLVLCWPC